MFRVPYSVYLKGSDHDFLLRIGTKLSFFHINENIYRHEHTFTINNNFSNRLKD